MTSRLMLVVALFGIFASATVTFAQYQQSVGEQQPPPNQQYGGQQGQYQGQMPPNQQGNMQGNPQDMMKQYQGKMPPGGFDPNMDPSRMGGKQGMQGQQGMMQERGGQYQGQGGQQSGQQGGQMPPGQGMMQGPGKEFFSRMIQEMKRNMKPFETMVKNAEKQVVKTQTSLQKCGVTVNFDELKKSITEAKDTVDKVKKIDADAEDVDFDPADVGGIAQSVSEGQRDLMHYQQFCRDIGQMEKDIKGVVKRFTSVERKLKSAKIDLSDSLTEQKEAIGKLQDFVKQAKEQASKDIEDAYESMEEFRDMRDDISDRERALQMAANFSRELKNLDRDAKRLATQVKSEKNRALKRKLPTEDMSDSVIKFNDAHAALKALAAKKNIDPEDLVVAMEDVFDARRDVDETLGQLRQGGPQKMAEQYALPQGWDDIAEYSQKSSREEGAQYGGESAPATDSSNSGQ